MHGPPKVGFAVHYWQGYIRVWIMAATAREDASCFDAIALQAFFPAFVAPAQYLMKVHHSCSIGIAETHATLKS